MLDACVGDVSDGGSDGLFPFGNLGLEEGGFAEMDKLDVVVRLEAGSCRDEMTHDDVLLETAEAVGLAEGGRLVEDTGGVLEGCGLDEAVGLERGLGDAEQHGGSLGGLAALGCDTLVLGL